HIQRTFPTRRSSNLSMNIHRDLYMRKSLSQMTIRQQSERSTWTIGACICTLNAVYLFITIQLSIKLKEIFSRLWQNATKSACWRSEEHTSELQSRFD